MLSPAIDFKQFSRLPLSDWRTTWNATALQAFKRNAPVEAGTNTGAPVIQQLLARNSPTRRVFLRRQTAWSPMQP